MTIGSFLEFFLSWTGAMRYFKCWEIRQLYAFFFRKSRLFHDSKDNFTYLFYHEHKQCIFSNFFWQIGRFNALFLLGTADCLKYFMTVKTILHIFSILNTSNVFFQFFIWKRILKIRQGLSELQTSFFIIQIILWKVLWRHSLLKNESLTLQLKKCAFETNLYQSCNCCKILVPCILN